MNHMNLIYTCIIDMHNTHTHIYIYTYCVLCIYTVYICVPYIIWIHIYIDTYNKYCPFWWRNLKIVRWAEVWYTKEGKTTSDCAIGAIFAIIIGFAVVISCCLSWFHWAHNRWSTFSVKGHVFKQRNWNAWDSECYVLSVVKRQTWIY